MLQHSVKWNCRPFIRPWLESNASVGQVVCAYGCSVANSNEQHGWRAPCSIDRALSHRRRMEIGPGGGSKGGAHMPAPSVDTYGCRDQPTCTHWERERVCVHVCAWGSVCLLTPADAHCSLDRGWSSYWWQYGAYRGGDLLGGPFCLCAAENSWIFSTSPHVVSWRSLQLEASPKYTVSNQAVVLPLLLHYHMNGCHIAIYCMAIVGKSLKIIGSYMVG